MIEINTHQWPFIRWKQSAPTAAGIGWFFLTVNILVTSTYNIFAKILTATLSPITLLFLSECLTIFFVLFSFGVFPTIKKLLAVPRSQLAPMLTIGLCNGVIGPLLWFTGLGHTTATNATLLGNTEMMFLALLAILILKEQWTTRHLISFSVMILGMVIISLEGFTHGISIGSGDILLILGSLCFGFGSILFRKFLHGTDPEVTVLVRSFVPVMLFAMLAPFFSYTFMHEVEALPTNGILALIGFGLLSRFLNTFSFYEAIEHLPVSIVSMFMNVVMVVAIAIAHFGLGEPLYAFHFIGGGLIMLGIIVLEFVGVHPTEEHLESHLVERKASRA
jgi:drug/metabolite transporter (DMT)-like permease